MTARLPTPERGSALFEVLAVGFVVSLLLSQAVVGVVRIHEAGDRATAAAQTAALSAARSGATADAVSLARTLVPGAVVSVWQVDREVHVVVSEEVSVFGPAGSPIRYTVTGRAAAVVSPYRSDE